MKIGLCCSIDKIHDAALSGFDYIEPSVSHITDLPEEHFVKILDLVKNSAIKPECFNMLFPSRFTLMGVDYSENEICKYLNKAFGRVAQLGGKIVVFGSGRFRNNPETYSYDEAYIRLIKLTGLIGSIAGNYDIKIAVEPLNRSETNMIVSIPEGIALLEKIKLSNVTLLADFYHMRHDNEPVSNILLAKEISHAHIARCQGRLYPLTESEDNYSDFFKSLFQISYTGRMSVEGNTADFQNDGKNALILLKKLSAEAGLSI